MENEVLSKWHIIIDGSGCPKDDEPVIGIWISGTETYGSLAYYDAEAKEWFSLNCTDKGDVLRDPDYWIELPLKLR